MKKNLFIIFLEIISFYLLLNNIDDSVVFNNIFLFICFGVGFVLGMQKSNIKYTLPLLMCVFLIFNLNTNNELLFMSYFIYSYIGVFTSSLIDKLNTVRHFTHFYKTACNIIIIMGIIFLIGMNI